MVKLLLRSAAILFMAAVSTIAQAQWLPSKPITLVVPYPAGGSSDVIARLISKNMTDALKTPVVVDNRPGGGTFIGSLYVKQAQPDGHTLYLVDLPLVVTPFVLPSARYDPLKDFTPISLVGKATQIFWGKTGGVESMPSLISRAKANPGQVSIGTPGAGSNTHLMVELLQKITGTKMILSHYRGSAPMFLDIANGTVEGGISALASGKPMFDAGKIVPLAVTSAKRQPAMPAIPTVAELGYPALALEHWWGVVGPAGMPRQIVERLNREIDAAVNDPGIREKFAGLAVLPANGTPDQFGALLQSELKVWSAIAKDANVRIE